MLRAHTRVKTQARSTPCHLAAPARILSAPAAIRGTPRQPSEPGAGELPGLRASDLPWPMLCGNAVRSLRPTSRPPAAEQTEHAASLRVHLQGSWVLSLKSRPLQPGRVELYPSSRKPWDEKPGAPLCTQQGGAKKNMANAEQRSNVQSGTHSSPPPPTSSQLKALPKRYLLQRSRTRLLLGCQDTLAT